MNSKKSAITFFLLFSSILGCFCSCSSNAAVRKNQPYANLTGSSKYFLLPAQDIESPLDMAQRISASWQGKNYSFNAWVQADETGMEMTLLNELGANMGDLSYRNGLVSFSSLVFPQSLKPEYIVADFQLCFYSVPPLRQALEDCGLSFESTENSRRIFQKETVIIEIEKSKDAVRLINHLQGYAYTLEGNFE
ncbi:MAG: DUF3261 domain-containing protein [Treponema sp.]|nr:DUF3261 domain-containing protein [Treponema sp.]